MRRCSPFHITLSLTERQKLERIVRCTTAPAGMVQPERLDAAGAAALAQRAMAAVKLEA